MRYLVRLAVVCGFAMVGGVSTVAGQGIGKIEGFVRTTDKKPVANATVLIVGTKFAARTDADGRYMIDSVPVSVPYSIVSVRTTMMGFKPLEVAGLRMRAGQTISGLDFPMEPAPITLTELATTFPPNASLMMRFQLIRPTTGKTVDKQIIAIDSVLRDLFQWAGYGLLAQSVMTADVHAGPRNPIRTSQLMNVDGQPLTLNVTVDSVTPNKVRMAIELTGYVSVGQARALTTLLSTTVTVWYGKTVVLGSTQSFGPAKTGSGTLILAVKPEIRWPQ